MVATFPLSLHKKWNSRLYMHAWQWSITSLLLESVVSWPFDQVLPRSVIQSSVTDCVKFTTDTTDLNCFLLFSESFISHVPQAVRTKCNKTEIKYWYFTRTQMRMFYFSFTTGRLLLHCKFRHWYKMSSGSVTQVYCDKITEARIMQFSLNVAQCLKSSPAKFDYNTRRGPLDRRAQTGVVWFSIDFATLYLGNACEIELRWQLITNKKSHGAFDCNKSRWPWMILNVNLLLYRQCYAYSDQTAEASIMQY